MKRLSGRPNDAGSRTRFLLIQWLLVIAIISLLMAIALPSLSAARAQARTVKCLSNIRQVGQAVMAFTADHGSKLPENRVAMSANTHVTWRHRLVEGNYLPSGDIWVCPEPSPTPAATR